MEKTRTKGDTAAGFVSRRVSSPPEVTVLLADEEGPKVELAFKSPPWTSSGRGQGGTDERFSRPEWADEPGGGDEGGEEEEGEEGERAVVRDRCEISFQGRRTWGSLFARLRRMAIGRIRAKISGLSPRGQRRGWSWQSSSPSEYYLEVLAEPRISIFASCSG